MAAIVNARDQQLQATSPRLQTVTLPDNMVVPAVKSLRLTAPSLQFKVTGSAAAPSSILITATPIQIIGTVSWSITGGTLTGSGAARTLSYSAMTADTAVITASLTENGKTYSDTITISKVRDGADGAAGAPGADGAAGSLVATATLYQWSTVQPGNPSGSSSWNWTTLLHSGYTGGNGWSTALPANPGTVGAQLWTAQKALSAPAGTTSSPVSWASGYTVVALSANGQDGQQGTPGAAGARFAIARAFKWSLAPAPTATGSATWTWASGTYNTAPTGWTTTPGTAPSPGLTLWEASVRLVDAATTTTSAINWGTATVAAIGYAGTDGAAGDAGAQGVSARVAYALVTGGVGALPATPASITSGTAAVPPVGSWQSGLVWTTSPGAPAAGQSVWVSDGLFNPATQQTTWYAPYLASLRVGQLSAISANLGTITAGSLDIGAGKSVIPSTGYASFRGVQILDESGNVILSTRTGATSGVPASYLPSSVVSGAAAGAQAAADVATLSAIGPNLLPNPELANAVGGASTAPGWTRGTNNGFVEARIFSPSTQPSYGPPWNRNAPVFYAQCAGAAGVAEYVRWLSDYIPVSPDTDYTVAGWARRYSSSEVRVFLGVICYDDAGTSLGNLYALSNAPLPQSWTRYSRVVGPSNGGFPAGTTRIRVVWYGSYNTGATTFTGSSFATRFTFNQGTVPTSNYAPYDPSAVSATNPISADNVASYLSTSALGAQRNVLGGVGGLVAGSLTWDAAGNATGGQGVAMTAKGIVGRNASGVTTIAIDATTGDVINRGKTEVGSSPAISGTVMTGAGALINADGTFALGNAAGSLVFDGSRIYLNQPVLVEPEPPPGPVESPGAVYVGGSWLGTAAGTTIAEIQFRADGGIYINRTAGTSNTTSLSRYWYRPLTTNVGSGYQVLFTIGTPTGGTMTGVWDSWQALTATRSIRLSSTSTSQFYFQVTGTYAVRRASDGVVVSSGSLTLSISRDF